MSRAKIGNSAVGLPSSTANKSSSTAPSTTFCRAMKVSPLNSDLRSSGARAATFRSMAMPSMTSPAESHNSAQTANTKVGLISTRMPPSAGPATTAVCEAEVEPAMARGSRSPGTMFGSTDCRLGCSKARPVPTTKAMARRSPGVSRPVALAKASTATASASVSCAAQATQRRS